MKKLLIILLLIVGCAHKPPQSTFYIGMTQEEFIEQNSLEVDLVASKGWNKETNGLILDEEIYDVD